MATIQIKRGDTLGGLARQHGTTVGALMAANPQIRDPNIIIAGARLTIPAAAPAPITPVPPPRTVPHDFIGPLRPQDVRLPAPVRVGVGVGVGAGAGAGAGAITPERQTQIAATQERIAEITAQIQALQRTVGAAQAAGIDPRAPIPAEILAGEPLVGAMLNLPDTKFADEALTDADAFLRWQLQEAERLRAEREEVRERERTVLDRLKGVFETREAMEARLERERARWQVPEQYERIMGLIPEIQAKQQRLLNLDLSYQRGRERIEQMPMAMPLIVGEQAALQRQWSIERAGVAAELSAKTAVAEMYRGNISLAENLISRSIDAFTYDTRTKVSEYEFLFNYYRDYVGTLDTRVQNSITNAYNILKDQETLERREMEQKWDLVRDAAAKGIDLSGELRRPMNEFMGIYSQRMAAVPVGVGVGVRETGIIPIEEARRWGVPYGTTFEQLREVGIVPGEPATKDFGTNWAPDWRQWDAVAGKWMPIALGEAGVIEGLRETPVVGISWMKEGDIRTLVNDLLEQEFTPEQIKERLKSVRSGDTPKLIGEIVDEEIGKKEPRGIKHWLVENIWRRLPFVK